MVHDSWKYEQRLQKKYPIPFSFGFHFLRSELNPTRRFWFGLTTGIQFEGQLIPHLEVANGIFLKDPVLGSVDEVVRVIRKRLWAYWVGIRRREAKGHGPIIGVVWLEDLREEQYVYIRQSHIPECSASSSILGMTEFLTWTKIVSPIWSGRELKI